MIDLMMTNSVARLARWNLEWFLGVNSFHDFVRVEQKYCGEGCHG